MKNYIWKIASLLVIISIVSSCSKEALLEDLNSDSSEDVASAEGMVQDAGDAAAYKMDPTDGLEEGGDCPAVTFASPKGTYPNTVTLDFGDGCVCERTGRVKAGKIIITQSDHMKSEGAVRSITPENFTVDGNAIEGVRTVTHLGFNEAGEAKYSVDVTAKVTFSGGKSVSWEASRIRTWIEGYATEEVEDDVFSITGGSSGTNRRGIEFTATIIEPLIAKRNCRWIVDGLRSVESDGKTRSLDYGDGNCDNDAVITFPNGKTKNIKLKR